MEFTKDQIAKQADYSIAFKIDGLTVSFRKKDVTISADGNTITIDDETVESSKQSLIAYREQQNKDAQTQTVTIKTNSTVEDFSEKSYKMELTLEINDTDKKEFSKSVFVAKSQVQAIKDNEITLLQWVWNSKVDEIQKESMKYSNETLGKNYTAADFQVLNEVAIN